MAYKTHTLRAGRFSESGSAYLVTVNTENRFKRFYDWVSARPVIHALRASDEARLTETYAWVVMPDHIHWLFTLGAADLGTVVGRMKSRSTVAINKQTEGRSKKVWQKGYHDRALRAEDSLLSAARYVVANPLRAGLVTHIGQYPMWGARWGD